ncbi:sugar transferase [Clostridium paraputrificum]|uniref:sugar transferase n=1 Tax=Clostridium paraputrificum TaxID=29363 RepID=UPI00374E290A
MYEKYFKRFLDIIICIIVLPVFLIIFIILGILIKIEDGGPILYVADRIGKDSKIFKMYKFRSMKVNSPNILNKDGSTYNAKDDFRVTKVGKFIRETSIDETAQIINVLKGDMSIIGPRASLADALSTYKEDELDKMLVRPGISGYTQAYYRNGLSVREKRLKDSWYSNNVTFRLDLKIILKTIITVFRQDGIYTMDKENNENL